MISVLYTIILITNFKLIEMCIKSSPKGRGVKCAIPLVVRKVLCVKLLSIKEGFMSNPPISSESFMRKTPIN